MTGVSLFHSTQMALRMVALACLGLLVLLLGMHMRQQQQALVVVVAVALLGRLVHVWL